MAHECGGGGGEQRKTFTDIAKRVAGPLQGELPGRELFIFMASRAIQIQR